MLNPTRTGLQTPMKLATRRAMLAKAAATRQMSSAPKEKLFDKILIANRGEIAVRVIRTCKKLGIKTVQIYSEPDVNTVAVKMADEAICVGPAASSQSYLQIPKIMDAIKKTGAQAVHPGYGFLSENKNFCDALSKAGVTFIGPGYEAIRAMGDKIESKLIAKEAKVNTIPGYLGIIDSPEDAIRVAREIGYPVMIKASAGGGGKGMRVAYNDEEVRIGYRLSKEEAASSFADDRMFVEKFIEDPRHVEIQLIADTHGNVVPLPERECSIQRRNQKVIEEAPSVLLDPETRKAMQAQAAMLARKVGYVSAGTCEFLCDKDKNFYFLEMNTRLQVEHPITEYISGVDLVEQMIRVAAGYALPDHMIKGVGINGWALEARVYAEDPLRGFLPSIGRLLRYKEPLSLPGVRVDSGVAEGSDISMYYDPMISKLVTHGKDRPQALERMRAALDNYVIRGPGNNISFLQDVFRHPRFISGKITTKFIAEEYPEGFDGVKLTPPEMDELVVLSTVMHLEKAHGSQQIAGSMERPRAKSLVPAGTIDPDELEEEDANGVAPRYRVWADDSSSEGLIKLAHKYNMEKYGEKFYVSTAGAFSPAIEVTVVEFEVSDKKNRLDTVYMMHVNDKWHAVGEVDWKINSPLFRSEYGVQGAAKDKSLGMQVMQALPEGYRLQHHGAIHDVIIRGSLEAEHGKVMQPKPEIDTSNLLLCPMPGALISVAVKEGDTVELGQELCVVEAMKMQNVLRSEKKGVIKAVKHKAGDSLKVDEIILEYE